MTRALIALLAGCWSSSTPSDNLSGCLRTRVVKLIFVGNTNEVTVSHGQTSGVSPDWRATLEDPARTPGQIVRVDHSTAVVVFDLTPDVVHRSALVRLCPP
jgi:hypothetical protein